jgi:hypothetical protein
MSAFPPMRTFLIPKVYPVLISNVNDKKKLLLESILFFILIYVGATWIMYINLMRCRLYSFPLHPSQMDIVKRNSAREDWWAGSAPSGPFIYTPFSKGEPNNNSKHELTWVVGEPVQVLVELANPCGFDLRVDSIYLSVHSGNFDAFPVSVNLPPNLSKVITLSGIPTSVGPVTVPGCMVHCFGVITEHLFRDVDNLLLGATQGLVLSDPFRCCGSAKLRNLYVPNISVVPPLPLLVSHVVGGDGAIILYEGEIRNVWINLSNAGTVPVEQTHISLSGKNQDCVTSVAYETLKAALPLKPGAEVTIPVTLKAWQLGLLDSDAAGGKSASGSMVRHSKDGNSPTLLIHYAGTFVKLCAKNLSHGGFMHVMSSDYKHPKLLQVILVAYICLRRKPVIFLV